MNELKESIPRADLSSQLNEKFLAKLSDSAWKARQPAPKEVEDLLAAAPPRIGPNVGGLVGALKARLADSNKNIMQQTIGAPRHFYCIMYL